MSEVKEAVKKSKKAPKAKAVKAKKVVAPKVPKVTVFSVIREQLREGKSKPEIVAVLAKKFTERDPESMGKTVSIQISRIPKEDKGLTITKTNDEKRGKVYKLTGKETK